MESNSVRARVRHSAAIREVQGLSILTFHAMGTLCRISIVEPSRAEANAYLDEALNWVADFEATYSRFIEGSLISRINSAAGREWIEVDEEAERLLSLCADMVFFTGGAFDPTSLPLVRLWNWKSSPPVIPPNDAIAKAKELVGWNKVQRRRGAVYLPAGMSLDLGGIGKEYAVDRVLTLAASHGVRHVLVDFGQDVRALGQPPARAAWHIGLEDPRSPGSCWGSVAASNHAVASSGDYLRCFQHEGRRYGHIIDPRTGCPVDNHCLSVNVVASTCTLAGILSTTAFILGPKDGYELINRTFGASGAIITETGTLITPRFYEHLVQQK